MEQNPQNYSKQVVSLIQQRIRSGKLRRGDKISELSLAEECGISRSPVRDALYQLETEGFIMNHPKRGKCVTILTPDDIRNRYELCGLLEGAGTAKAAEAARRKGHRWEELQLLLTRMKNHLYDGSKLETHADLGTEFHRTILEWTSNPLLATFSNRSCRVVSKYLMFQQWRTMYTPNELYERHYAIYQVLLDGDARAIEETVRAHYMDSAGRLADLCAVQTSRAPLRTSRKAHFPTE